MADAARRPVAAFAGAMQKEQQAEAGGDGDAKPGRHGTIVASGDYLTVTGRRPPRPI